jgi:hypothetical protein
MRLRQLRMISGLHHASQTGMESAFP